MNHNNLASYVKERGWSFHREAKRYLLYIPPKTLGMPDDFILSIPKLQEAPDHQEVLDDTIDFVARIYQIESAEILSSMNGAGDEKVELPDEDVVELSVEN